MRIGCAYVPRSCTFTHLLLFRESFDVIFCTAGGWAGGDASSLDMLDGVESMYSACIASAAASAYLASSLLKPGGMLVLTGSAAALGGTPGMLGYGMAKAATHQLVASLSAGEGLPAGVRTVAVLPGVIDTPGNRGGMPDADTSTWTPASAIAEQVLQWESLPATAPSGSMWEPVTADGKTQWEQR